MNPSTEQAVLREFDHLRAYEADAIALARAYPDLYQLWCKQVEAGERIWHARDGETE